MTNAVQNPSTKQTALIEEAARRAFATRGQTQPSREAVTDAVRAAYAGGTKHMFGLVRAGSSVRT